MICVFSVYGKFSGNSMETGLCLQVFSKLMPNVVGSTDQESSHKLRTWFSEHFFAPKLVA